MSVSKEKIDTELKNDDMTVLHRSPDVEYSFYTAVKTGDIEAVNRNCQEDAFINMEGTGTLSKNPLTNKLHAIAIGLIYIVATKSTTPTIFFTISIFRNKSLLPIALIAFKFAV